MFKFWLRFNRYPAVAAVVLTRLIALLLCANAAVAQTPQGFPFRATYYEVEVLLHPEDQTISAQAKVELIALQPGRTVVVELHQDLRVNSVKLQNGGALEFERDNRFPLLLTIGLPDVVSPGKTVTLVFDYTGPISSEEDSPTRGVRFASRGQEWSVLAAAGALVSADELSHQSLYRKIQDRCSGYFCGDRNW